MEIRQRAKLASIFLISMGIAALGSPDRGVIPSLLAYAFGYSGILYCVRFLTKKWLPLFFWAMGVFGCQLSWLATTHYHGIGIVFAYLFVTLVFAVQFAFVFRMGMHRPFSWGRGLVLASTWTLVEWSRLFYFCGFPFSTVGLVMTGDPVLMQIASVFGVYGLSFFVILMSYVLAWGRWNSWAIGSLAMLLFSMAHIYFWKQTGTPLHVCLVQTGFTQEEKWRLESDVQEQWDKILLLLQETKQEKFDFIILPEVAVVGDAHDKNEGVSHLDRIEELAKRFQSDVVIGLLDGPFNAVFHASPRNSVKERYEKRVLVPMAEYLPLGISKSFLTQYGIHSFFIPGKEAKVFVGKIPFSVSICYEEGYAHLIQEGRKRGAELLINVSNDGWFPKSRLPEEHFNLGRVRAVENGVFVLRACNTGVTAAIDPFGRILCAIKEKDGSGVQTITIHQFSYPTVFSVCGNTVILTICFLSISANFLIKRKRFSKLKRM